MFGDATGNNPIEMLKLWLEIDGNTMKTHPFAQADANGSDFVFRNGAAGREGLVGALYPYANPSVANLSGHIELGQSGNHPMFEVLYELSHIAPAFSDIE